MEKCLNRNHLKIIAVISMLVDHIGLFFFPDLFFFRVLGRIAFPVFAFFVAEGFFYTHSKAKYLATLLAFACVSQIPYGFLFGSFFSLNILFSFSFAVLFLWLFKKVVDLPKDQKVLPALWLGLLTIVLIAFSQFYSYGFLGVLTVFVFYYFRNSPNLKFVLFGFLMICMGFLNVIYGGAFSFESMNQCFAIFAILFLVLYNGQKGKINLKYLFYVFYPLHLYIIWLLTMT